MPRARSEPCPIASEQLALAVINDGGSYYDRLSIARVVLAHGSESVARPWGEFAGTWATVTEIRANALQREFGERYYRADIRAAAAIVAERTIEHFTELTRLAYTGERCRLLLRRCVRAGGSSYISAQLKIPVKPEAMPGGWNAVLIGIPVTVGDTAVAEDAARRALVRIGITPADTELQRVAPVQFDIVDQGRMRLPEQFTGLPQFA